jgi:hypothetical protein
MRAVSSFGNPFKEGDVKIGYRNLAVVAAVLVCSPFSARAAQPPATPEVGSGSDVRPGAPGHWSIITGETVATGQNAVSAELGFPGFTFGVAHGVNDRFDVGAKLDFLYGFRNTTLVNDFGMQLRVPLRYMVYRRGQVSVQVHADPGLDFYTTSQASFAINVPFGATVGFQASPELRLAIGADLPFSLNYSPTAYLQTGPLFGGALEYFFERQWSAGFNFRFGPQFFTRSGPGTQLGFVTEVTVGYRL